MDDIFNNQSAGIPRKDISIFWHLAKPHFGRLVGALVCGLVLSGINGAIAWSVKPTMDTFFLNKNPALLYLFPIGVIILFCFRGIFTYCNHYLMSSIGAKIVKSLRQDLYNRLLRLPYSYYTRTSSGSIVSKTLNDIGLLQTTVASTIKDFIVEGGTIIVLAIVAITRKWDLALLSFIVLPLMIYSIARLGKVMKKTSMGTRIFISRITSILHETLQGLKIIKAFTMEREMSKRNDNALTDHYRNTMREVRITEVSSLMAEVLGGVGIAIILFYGGHIVMSDKMTIGSFFSFVVAILMMYTPLKRISRVHNNFQQGRNVIERIREIVSVAQEKEGGIEKEIKGHIVFEDVSFKYPASDGYSIRNISFEVKPGEIVALVGHSGAGKSTVVDLIAGFWYPSDGAIYVDDTDIRDLSLTSLRGHMGIVTQDVVLFDDTIKSNILFGKPDVSGDEVIEAAKAAYAHEFIMQMPEGYDTETGERGVRLSGGQKQRITLARAILRNPSVLILDEATSALDTESEQKVQMALEKLMKGRTTIVIAHRLSTVRTASRIIVMERGKIVQQGDHESLLSQGGLYRELYAMQFEGSNTGR